MRMPAVASGLSERYRPEEVAAGAGSPPRALLVTTVEAEPIAAIALSHELGERLRLRKRVLPAVGDEWYEHDAGPILAKVEGHGLSGSVRANENKARCALTHVAVGRIPLGDPGARPQHQVLLPEEVIRTVGLKEVPAVIVREPRIEGLFELSELVWIYPRHGARVPDPMAQRPIGIPGWARRPEHLPMRQNCPASYTTLPRGERDRKVIQKCTSAPS
jgi:hypothetical protein